MTANTESMTGYDPEDRYYASRYEQGGRTVYAIDLSLAQVAGTLPRPDPNHLTPGNRRVNDRHAQAFGKYVRENKNWIAPALLLRAPDVFSFEAREVVQGTQFGILSLPRLARTDLKILDGQHRILGLYYAVEDVAAKLEEIRSHIAGARREQNHDIENHFRQEMIKVDEQRTRLNSERISVQIHIEEELKEFQQMFVDIAENALGIQSAIRTRFDKRKVVNRALDDVLKHALFENRVDLEQDRIGGSNRNLLGAKHVADIIRTVTVGLAGRVGRRQEDELREAEMVENTNRFLDVLVGGFPALENLIDGSSLPQDLRKTSLLGSATMLRVLASVYHELGKAEMSDDTIQEFFSRLAPNMAAPVNDASPWMEDGVFSPGAMAPKARRQDLQSLARTTVRWAKQTPKWLAAETGQGKRAGGRTRKPQTGQQRRRAARRSGHRSRGRAPRTPAGVLLPESEYVVPLLSALAERGGSAPVRDVLEAVGQALDGKLTPVDNERITSGTIRWRNRTQFVRLQLVAEGLMAKDSPRGVWSLTDAGRARLTRDG